MTPEIPVVETPKPDPIEAKLEFSSEWSDEPFFAGQDGEFPNTVRVVEQAYKTLSTSNKEDMEEYSHIALSSLQQLQYLILSEERHWCESEGTWKILVGYQKRKFKTLKGPDA